MSLLGSNAFGDFQWPQMSSNVWEKGFGCFQSPPMFSVALGNAKFAKKMLEGRDGQSTKITKRIICNNLKRSLEQSGGLIRSR